MRATNTPFFMFGGEQTLALFCLYNLKLFKFKICVPLLTPTSSKGPPSCLAKTDEDPKVPWSINDMEPFCQTRVRDAYA